MLSTATGLIPAIRRIRGTRRATRPPLLAAALRSAPALWSAERSGAAAIGGPGASTSTRTTSISSTGRISRIPTGSMTSIIASAFLTAARRLPRVTGRRLRPTGRVRNFAAAPRQGSLARPRRKGFLAGWVRPPVNWNAGARQGLPARTNSHVVARPALQALANWNARARRALQTLANWNGGAPQKLAATTLERSRASAAERTSDGRARAAPRAAMRWAALTMRTVARPRAKHLAGVAALARRSAAAAGAADRMAFFVFFSFNSRRRRRHMLYRQSRRFGSPTSLFAVLGPIIAAIAIGIAGALAAPASKPPAAFNSPQEAAR